MSGKIAGSWRNLRYRGIVRALEKLYDEQERRGSITIKMKRENSTNMYMINQSTIIRQGSPEGQTIYQILHQPRLKFLRREKTHYKLTEAAMNIVQAFHKRDDKRCRLLVLNSLIECLPQFGPFVFLVAKNEDLLNLKGFDLDLHLRKVELRFAGDLPTVTSSLTSLLANLNLIDLSDATSLTASKFETIEETLGFITNKITDRKCRVTLKSKENGEFVLVLDLPKKLVERLTEEYLSHVEQIIEPKICELRKAIDVILKARGFSKTVFNLNTYQTSLRLLKGLELVVDDPVVKSRKVLNTTEVRTIMPRLELLYGKMEKANWDMFISALEEEIKRFLVESPEDNKIFTHKLRDRVCQILGISTYVFDAAIDLVVRENTPDRLRWESAVSEYFGIQPKESARAKILILKLPLKRPSESFPS